MQCDSVLVWDIGRPTCYYLVTRFVTIWKPLTRMMLQDMNGTEKIAEFELAFELDPEDRSNAGSLIMSGMAIWMSNLARASSRRQIVNSAITYLEVIMPASWTAMYLSGNGHLLWMCRALDAPTSAAPWSSRQRMALGKLAKEAVASRQVIVTNPPADAPQGAPGTLYLVPLTIQTRTHGVLAVIDEQRHQQNLTASETGLVMVISRILALALDRAELARQLRAMTVTTQPAKRRAGRAGRVGPIRKLTGVAVGLHHTEAGD